MSNADINVDRQMDGWTDGHLYHTLLQAGAIKKVLAISYCDGDWMEELG